MLAPQNKKTKNLMICDLSQQSNFILSAPHGTTMLRYSHIIIGLTAIIKTERLLIEKKSRTFILFTSTLIQILIISNFDLLIYFQNCENFLILCLQNTTAGHNMI